MDWTYQMTIFILYANSSLLIIATKADQGP